MGWWSCKGSMMRKNSNNSIIKVMIIDKQANTEIQEVNYAKSIHEVFNCTQSKSKKKKKMQGTSWYFILKLQSGIIQSWIHNSRNGINRMRIDNWIGEIGGWQLTRWDCDNLKEKSSTFAFLFFSFSLVWAPTVPSYSFPPTEASSQMELLLTHI